MSETKATGRGRKVGRIIGRTMAIIGRTLVAVFISLYSMLWIFCHGPSKSARNLFVSTILETGALKFLAGWYFDDEEILEITSNNNMIHNDNEVDTDLIDSKVRIMFSSVDSTISTYLDFNVVSMF